MTPNTNNAVPEKVLLHKDFLCYYSPFFNAAFNSRFKEGLTQQMTLQADVTTFGVVAEWFYTQRMEHPSSLDLAALARIWILAERFLLPQLQNMVMNQIHERLFRRGEVLFSGTFAEIAGSHGDGENPLFKIAVDVLV
ncbi:hypothetical protein N431DRAFT_332035 [Stipitochalara longipes BDJ]|nr:hypothetical protein N431DRAFT_332035 [Stipitochalara longipes BDJ]